MKETFFSFSESKDISFESNTASFHRKHWKKLFEFICESQCAASYVRLRFVSTRVVHKWRHTVFDCQKCQTVENYPNFCNFWPFFRLIFDRNRQFPKFPFNRDCRFLKFLIFFWHIPKFLIISVVSVLVWRKFWPSKVRIILGIFLTVEILGKLKGQKFSTKAVPYIAAYSFVFGFRLNVALPCQCYKKFEKPHTFEHCHFEICHHKINSNLFDVSFDVTVLIFLFFRFGVPIFDLILLPRKNQILNFCPMSVIFKAPL